MEIRIHPLTYAKFLQFHELQDSDENLMTYLNYGGLPDLRNLRASEQWTLTYRRLLKMPFSSPSFSWGMR